MRPAYICVHISGKDFLTIKPIGGTASVYSKKQSETGGGIVGEGEEVGDLW